MNFVNQVLPIFFPTQSIFFFFLPTYSLISHCFPECKHKPSKSILKYFRRVESFSFLYLVMSIKSLNIVRLRNLYADQEATVRTRHGTMDWFKVGKEGCQGCILSLCLSNFYAKYIMWNARVVEAPGEISVNSNMQMKLPLWQKVKRN